MLILISVVAMYEVQLVLGVGCVLCSHL